MTALALEAHNDDVTLFCAFNAIRHRAHIVTVLRSVNQEANGITAAEREAESVRAADAFGCSWTQWYPFGDDEKWEAPAELFWPEIADLLRSLDREPRPDMVFAPWPEPGGHPQHNRVGELAREVFGDRVTYYTTYRFGGPRTTGDPVPYEREWLLRKLRALACFESQILRGPYRFWEMPLTEYTRPA